MERIDREYAIIYVDRTGETLTCRGQATRELISDYYKQSGFLQWNFYLIIAEETIEDVEGISAAERIKAILACDEYTRKYIMPEVMIDDFIENHFPMLQKERGKVEMIQAEDFFVTKKLALKKDSHDVKLIPSINRNYNLDVTLRYMDDMRRELIGDPDLHIIFYTHIQNEFSLARKKFNLFLIEE